MHWKPRNWMLIGALLAAMTITGAAQVATTQVADTIYHADGTVATGTVLISWPAFTTSNGDSIPTGSTSAVIAAGGALSVQLIPNAGSTPIGSYYTAVFHLDDSSVSRQYWVVPVNLAAVKISAIESTVLPTTVAMQTVSKSYVDTAIAAAVTGHPLDSTPYVLKAGDTMTGPLVLPADPVSANQAADKNYVDESVAATSGGGSGTITAVAGTAPVVSSGGTTPAISMPAATTSVDGYLDHADWNTFNGKQAALANPVTGPGSGAAVGHLAVMGNTSGTSITDGGAVPSSLPPSGSASGDLSGSYPNPTVAQFNGAAVPASAGFMATNSSKQLIAAAYSPLNPANNLSDLLSATTARSNLGLGTAAVQATSYFQAVLGYTPAHSGANSDIASLSGLTTPLSAAQGGTGAATAGAYTLFGNFTGSTAAPGFTAAPAFSMANLTGMTSGQVTTALGFTPQAAIPNTLGCLDGYNHLPCVVYVQSPLSESAPTASYATVYTTSAAGIYRVSGTFYMTSASSTSATMDQYLSATQVGAVGSTTYVSAYCTAATLLCYSDPHLLFMASGINIQTESILGSGTNTGGAWTRFITVERLQ